MNNIVCIHGYNGIPPIYHWIKNELIKRNYKVDMPKFPPKEGVKYSDWSKILEDSKIDIQEETIIVAHSIGNAFIMKQLANSPKKIKAFISLAGFADYFEVEGKEDLNRAIKDFTVTDKEIEKFKDCTSQRYSIYSDNDHIVPFSVLEEYVKKIDATALFIKGIGHMGSKSGVEELPELLETVEKLIKM